MLVVASPVRALGQTIRLVASSKAHKHQTFRDSETYELAGRRPDGEHVVPTMLNR
jgi:hypothetical protein